MNGRSFMTYCWLLEIEMQLLAVCFQLNILKDTHMSSKINRLVPFWSPFFDLKTDHLFILHCSWNRGGSTSQRPCTRPLPRGYLQVFHRGHRLRDEAHEPAHDPSLSVRQEQTPHHRPQPRFRRSAHGVRTDLEQDERPALSAHRLAHDMRQAVASQQTRYSKPRLRHSRYGGIGSTPHQTFACTFFCSVWKPREGRLQNADDGDKQTLTFFDWFLPNILLTYKGLSPSTLASMTLSWSTVEECRQQNFHFHSIRSF